VPALKPEVEEDLQIQIDKNYFGNWAEIEITLGIDTFATVSLTAPFALENRKFRDNFRPFQFQQLEVDTHLQQLFNGYILTPQPKHEVNSTSVTVTGYAKPAVLCDCSMPVLHPLTNAPVPREFKKLGLSAIFQSICDPFGIKVDFQGPEGKPFDKVRCGPEKKLHEFMVDLAKQRSLVLGNTVDGKLLVWQSVEPGNPVARFLQGQLPLTTVEANFSPQEYFSEITGFAAKKRGKAPAKWTEQNPWLLAPFRPHTFKLEDTERADAPEATQAKLGRMYANIVTYTLPDLPTWRDPSGEVWRPNTTVSLLYPPAMIYTETEFLIRTVKLKSNKDATTASLELCLPGAFNGKVPSSLPWDEFN
jgi:prophage tail gpP-like protein